MKKTILSAVAMATMLFGMQAQTVIQTYDACDANLNNEVNVGDAEVVAAQVLHNTTGPNVVTAEQLNTVLQEIYQLLGKLTMLDDLSERLSAVEEKLGIETDSPVVDPYNGHEYVDLGVVVDGKPVYWATTNIGAEQPQQFGLYFAWGETQGYTASDASRAFDWASYNSALCGGDAASLKKYCNNDGKTVLDPEDDAAHVLWQGAWRMPTWEELKALRTQCNWEKSRMEITGTRNPQYIDGYKVSNKQDPNKSIFLPAACERIYDDTFSSSAMQGRYWSASVWSDFNYEQAYHLYFNYNSDELSITNMWRFGGLPIRPVCQPQ